MSADDRPWLWKNPNDFSVRMPPPRMGGMAPGWQQAPSPVVETPWGPARQMVFRAERSPDATAWQRFNYPSPFEAGRVQAPWGPGGRQPVFPRVAPHVQDFFRHNANRFSDFRMPPRGRLEGRPFKGSPLYERFRQG